VSVAVWLNALGEQRQQTRLDQWGDTAFSRDGRISRCMLATVAGCTRDQEVLNQMNDPFNTSVAFLNAAIAPLENAEQVLFAPLCALSSSCPFLLLQFCIQIKSLVKLLLEHIINFRYFCILSVYCP